MAAGLPVIASNFPTWQSIIDQADCGLTVNPLDVEGISAAMTFLMKHPARRHEMAVAGRLAVEQRYNWEVEESELHDLYRALLGGK
jgi:glycosyltransferase involved in cell wall biosynthesis